MRSRRAGLITVMLLTGLIAASGQPHQPEYDELWFVRVWFNGKSTTVSDHHPEELLSPAAIIRRERLGIPLLSWSDLPVSSNYVSALAGEGLIPWSASRWLNSGLFASPTMPDTARLREYEFVVAVQLVKRPTPAGRKSLTDPHITEAQAGTSYADPRVPLNGNILHLSGKTGRGITIAVIDAGFVNSDAIEALRPLRQRGGITATYDFVKRSTHLYDYHTHGTAVLSILAGSLPGQLHGTAPDASYILLRSEDNNSEYPVEEDHWVAAAEYADSAGADIITSSLGYSLFDEPGMSYSFDDLDGASTFITRGANMAATKGMLVVISAGNERNKPWQRITAPSDGTGVLGVGALSADLTIAPFSSAGYNASGMVKPDVVAPGVSVILQTEPGMLHSGSGTSFSCPVVSGLAASLMQAVPAAPPEEVMRAIRSSSDRYQHPDSLYGYGMPDFIKALRVLEEHYLIAPDAPAAAGPNPFTDEIMIWFPASPQSLAITLVSADGRVVMERHFTTYVSRSYRVSGLEQLAQGLYLLKVVTSQGEQVFKMIRRGERR